MREKITLKTNSHAAILTSSLKSVMIAIVEKIADIIGRDFGEIISLQNAAPESLSRFVEKTLERVEQHLIKSAAAARSTFGMLLVQEDSILLLTPSNTTYYWLVYPVAGEGNLSRAISDFAIQLAIVDGSDFTFNENNILQQKLKISHIVAAAVASPMMRESFYADQSVGAFLNNETRLRCSRISGNLYAASSGFGYSYCKDHKLQTRISGCLPLDLCYLAAGRFDFVVASADDFATALPAHFIAATAGTSGKIITC